MIAALLPDLWPYLAGLLAFIGLGAGIYAKGRKDYKAKTALQAAEDYAKTRKDMDDADTLGNDPDAARRWLRERGEQ